MRLDAFPFVFGAAPRDCAAPALRIQRLPLPAALAGCIREIAVAYNRARTLDAAPTTGALLALRLSGEVSASGVPVPALSVTGLQTRARSYEYTGPTLTWLVRLTPQGSRCLGVPPRSLTDTIVCAADLPAGPALVALHQQLLATHDSAAALAALEGAFRALPFEPDPLVERALALLKAAPSRIATLAARLGVSERQLERRFVAAVGVSPKRFASLLRFERALPVLDHRAGLASVAQACGYYDQPHLSREIKGLTGNTPARWQREVARSLTEVAMSDSYKPPS